LKREFLALDQDGDGDISTAELKALLKSMKTRLRMSETEINRLCKSFDIDGDGKIDIPEFLQIIQAGGKRDIIHKALIQRSGIRKSFEKYDKDGNGLITRDEFRKVVEDKYQAKLNSAQIDDLMRQADFNQDGRLDYEEFVKSFTYMPVTS
jgi:calmodulin